MSKPAWTGAEPAIEVDNKSWLVIDGGTNGVIECTDNGTSKGNQESTAVGVELTTCDDCIVRNLIIRNMYVRDSGSAELVIGSRGVIVTNSSNFLAENLTINDVWTGVDYRYSIAGISNGEIRNNTISRVTFGVRVPSSPNSTLDDVRIHGNHIFDFENWATGNSSIHADGIQAFDRTNSGADLTNLKIYNNLLEGPVGNFTTSFIFVQANAPLIYNNVTRTQSGSNPTNGHLFMKAGWRGTGRIYNNTFIGHTTAGGAAIDIQASGTAIVRNNIVKGMKTAWRRNSGAQPIQTADNNVFFGLNATQAFWDNGHFDSLASWQSHTGHDLDAITTDPLLDANFRLQSGSPAIDAGADLSAFFTTDRDGDARPQGFGWDIGADELVSTSGTPPTNLRVIVR